MKIWLDDIRPAPTVWKHVLWPQEAIELLKDGDVTQLSLDHDLGDDVRGTGYDVLLWIEQESMLHGFNPPDIVVHSANVSAKQKMMAAIAKIKRIERANRQNKTVGM